MFDEVTKKEGGKNAARRAGYVVGSTAFQIVLVAAIIAATTYRATHKSDEPVVDVKFVKPVAPPPPPPPPAPPAARPKRPPSEKPRTDLPKPPPPQALLQPKEVQAEMKPPDPNEPPEPEYDYGDDSGEGVVGGVVGAQPSAIEDAPQFATSGYVKPHQATPNCVQSSVRVPPSLTGFVSGPIPVKFAIGKDGAPSKFQVMAGTDNPQIGEIIWRAVQACKWVPGADPQGRPTSIWVILPLRFQGG